MRMMTGAIAVIIAGCAGTPTAPSPAPITVASQPAGGAPAETGTDTERLSHAKKLGLVVMTVKGEVLYCRTERKTGSHLATETSCLTQQQLDDLHDQTSQDLDNFRRPQLPKPGR